MLNGGVSLVRVLPVRGRRGTAYKAVPLTYRSAPGGTGYKAVPLTPRSAPGWSAGHRLHPPSSDFGATQGSATYAQDGSVDRYRLPVLFPQSRHSWNPGPPPSFRESRLVVAEAILSKVVDTAMRMYSTSVGADGYGRNAPELQSRVIRAAVFLSKWSAS